MAGPETQEAGGAEQTKVPNTLRGDLFDRMECWAVYWNPPNYPKQWMVQRMVISDLIAAPHEVVTWANTLEEIRAFRPEHTIILTRHDEADPACWEVWL